MATARQSASGESSGSSSRTSDKTIPCRFFALGSCSRGRACNFAHDPLVRSAGSTVCSFFLRGDCRYGDHCRLRHVRPDAFTTQSTASSSSSSARLRPASGSTSAVVSVPTASISVGSSNQRSSSLASSQRDLRPLCPFNNKGLCKFGSACKRIHGAPCPHCAEYILHPDDSEQSHQEHITNCHTEQMRNDSQRKLNGEQTCAVCMETVVEKSDPRFGLLSCDHCACLECIRTWRSKEGMSTSKTCPLCRTVTHFVVPSIDWPRTEAAKERIIQEYRLQLKKIDCKHYKYGEGTCPFSTSCLYRHVDRGGVPERPRRRRFVMGASEEDELLLAMERISLFEFLERYEL